MANPSPALSTAARTELGKAMRAFRRALFGAGLMSGVLNILSLTGSFFMLLVYDTVIPAHSEATLIGLVALLLVMFAFQGVLDMLRGRVLSHIGASLDASISGRVYGALSRMATRSRPQSEGLQPLRDLDQIRAFLASPGPSAFFDVPWIFIYLLIAFLFHWQLGVATLVGAIVLIGLTVLTDRASRSAAKETSALAAKRFSLAQNQRDNAEAIKALGMEGRLSAAWNAVNREYLEAHLKSVQSSGGYLSLSRVSRMALQSLVLALGAWLVLQREATAGVIIASSILVARALAPVEQAIGSWNLFTAARQGWTRICEMMAAFPADGEHTPLPAPRERVAAEQLSLNPPGVNRIVVADVSLKLEAGQALAVLGPSGSGKSALARGLVGVWPPARGLVRVDGAALDQWDSDLLGKHIGYLPQDVELLSGTVVQNIARFEDGASSDAIVAAAKRADVHDMILRLPNGYDTEVGRGGAALSAGQRQRVALARALYGDPFLLVLDEPNAHLDSDGEQALSRAILDAKARGAAVIVVAHRPGVVEAVDLILFMRDGRALAFGPKDEVLPKILGPRPAGVVEMRRG